MQWSENTAWQSDPPIALATLDQPVPPSTGTVGATTLPNGAPQSLHLTRSSLAGDDSECHWLRVLKVEQQFELAELGAEVADDGVITVHIVRNVQIFEVAPPIPRAASLTVQVQAANKLDNFPHSARSGIPLGWMEFPAQCCVHDRP